MRHLREAFKFFEVQAINRNFEKGFFVSDLQGNEHYVTSRGNLWRVSWKTTKEGKLW